MKDPRLRDLIRFEGRVNRKTEDKWITICQTCSHLIHGIEMVVRLDLVLLRSGIWTFTKYLSQSSVSNVQKTWPSAPKALAFLAALQTTPHGDKLEKLV